MKDSDANRTADKAGDGLAARGAGEASGEWALAGAIASGAGNADTTSTAHSDASAKASTTSTAHRVVTSTAEVAAESANASLGNPFPAPARTPEPTTKRSPEQTPERTLSLPPFPGWPATSQTARALEIYDFSPYPVDLGLIRSILEIKLACATMNLQIGALSAPVAQAISQAIDQLRGATDQELRPWFSLDAFQGGAGTAMNMNVNEAIALLASHNSGLSIDPLQQVNLHASTNDVLPTALRLMLLRRFTTLEGILATCQSAAQGAESAWAAVLVPGHTQLQEAVPLSLGRIAATWAAGLARDRWRSFKARERLKEVNLGGTAIGTGAGAPRSFVLGVIAVLQRQSGLALARAEDCVEATSNFDGLVEAMGVLETLAVNLRRIAQDIRLLSSGPESGLGLLSLPALVKGSSMMPAKVNPVLAEAIAQNAEALLANHSLIARLAASSELQLNAFFPLIAQRCAESCTLAEKAVASLGRFIPLLKPNSQRAAQALKNGPGANLVLSPLFGYDGTERLIAEARAKNLGLYDYLASLQILDPSDMDWLFSPRTLQAFGYDEAAYARLTLRYGDAIQHWKDSNR